MQKTAIFNSPHASSSKAYVEGRPEEYELPPGMATDELLAEKCLGDESWQALGERFSTEQMMDFVFTVGQYAMLAMALNSFGVQLEPGTPGFPD